MRYSVPVLRSGTPVRNSVRREGRGALAGAAPTRPAYFSFDLPRSCTPRAPIIKNVNLLGLPRLARGARPRRRGGLHPSNGGGVGGVPPLSFQKPPFFVSKCWLVLPSTSAPAPGAVIFQMPFWRRRGGNFRRYRPSYVYRRRASRVRFGRAARDTYRRDLVRRAQHLWGNFDPQFFNSSRKRRYS